MNLDKDLQEVMIDELSGKPSSTLKTTEIWEFSTPTTQVAEFIKSIVRTTFPCEMVWGSKHNENQMMRHIDTYIGLGRTESMSISQATHGLQLRYIPWLTKLNQEVSDSLKTSLLFYFINWFFNDFITPCVAAIFYVTEVEGKLSELFFFKKKLWLNLIRKHLQQFHEQFRPVSTFIV